MSREAIAALEAEIEKREDEIVAIREVIAMLTGRAKPDAQLPAIAAPKLQPVAKLAKGKASAAVIELNGVEMQLSARELQAFDLLSAARDAGGGVSADMMEEVFGAGQARHDGIHRLKYKLQAAGCSITWSKAAGYMLLDKVTQ
jgi:hypothetical protein